MLYSARQVVTTPVDPGVQLGRVSASPSRAPRRVPLLSSALPLQSGQPGRLKIVDFAAKSLLALHPPFPIQWQHVLSLSTCRSGSRPLPYSS